jgi:DNA-binding NarL/FixJ family response regulator
MQGALRVAVCDDQALVLTGLARLLKDLAVDVVHECSSADSLLSALAMRGVDVIISDVRMPGTDGIQMTRKLRATGIDTPVILLTTFHDEMLPAAVDAGAQGFLLKDASPAELLSAIQRVAAGETLMQPISPGPVRARVGGAPQSAPALSEREKGILRLVAGGYSNKEIARLVHLSEGTVKNYVSDLLIKLDSRDRTHAVLRAISQGLL